MPTLPALPAPSAPSPQIEALRALRHWLDSCTSEGASVKMIEHHKGRSARVAVEMFGTPEQVLTWLKKALDKDSTAL